MCIRRRQEALAQAKRKAESVLAEVRKTSQFGELAKKYSDDPGSAKNGGDLDFFGRGAMVKPFEDAVFAMKEGEVRGPVESSFGFQIIKLTDIRSDKDGEQRRASHILIAKPQGEMGNLPTKDEFVQKARRQAAEKKYAEAAEQFSNLVYEQSDSLAPVSERLKLEVKTATQLQRKPAPGVTGVLANPKFLAAVFSPDSLEKKRNTEAIEVGPSQLAAARVIEYTPARTKPLAEVSASVKARLVAIQAAELAKKDGAEKLAAWKVTAPASLPTQVVVSRENAQTVPAPVLEAILQADTVKLPTWVGVDLGPQGLSLIHISEPTRPY